MRVARLAMRLAFFRRDGSDARGESRVRWRILGTVADRGARRLFAQIIVPLPIFRRSNRSRHEAAAAVGADVIEDRIDGGSAKRALVGADARLERIGRQRLVAMFAGRSELEHRSTSESDSFGEWACCCIYFL